MPFNMIIREIKIKTKDCMSCLTEFYLKSGLFIIQEDVYSIVRAALGGTVAFDTCLLRL